MNVSSVPIAVSSSSKHQQRHRQNHSNHGPAYDDLTKQKLLQSDSGELVEDHLEDLVNLPIASELIPRRARSKVSLAASDSTHNTSIFPQASTSNIDLADPAVSLLSQTAIQNENKTVFKLDKPPKRSDSLRKRTQSTPLRSSPQGIEPLSNGNTLTPTNGNGSKKAKVEQSPRTRAVTGNLNSAVRKPTSSSSSAANGRKPLQDSSNRQVSTPIRKATSPSPSTAASSQPLRSRSHSATLLSSYDTEAKPPWLEEQDHLYKSDLTSPAPGSLAHIAMHAQGQHSSPSHAGDKSWDDVIIPTVAKQIRAQQALHASTGSSSMEASPSKQGTSALTDEGDLLITDWYPDGTPKKWKRVGKAQRERMMKEQQQSSHNEVTPQAASDSSQESDGLAPRLTVQSDDREVEIPQTSEDVPDHLFIPNSAPFTRNTFEIGQSTTVQFSPPPHSSSIHSDSRSVNSNSAPTRSRTNTAIGRTEIWQEPGLTSPTVAKTTHGFGAMQPVRQHQVLSGSKEQQFLPKQEQQNVQDGGTHKGGCRCIIM